MSNDFRRGVGIFLLNSEKKLNDFSKFIMKNKKIKYIKFLENTFKIWAII